MPTRRESPEEWLEPDSLGGFALGPSHGPRTRRYHSLLTIANSPPSDRTHLVKGFDAFVETPDGRFPLTEQHYAGAAPDPISHLRSFTHHPWPRWTFRLPSGLVVEQELIVPREREAVMLRWRAHGATPGTRLIVRPFLCASRLHDMHHANTFVAMDPARPGPGTLTWQLYQGAPAIHASSNASYRHSPEWYRSFFYAEEASRGLDAIEDLPSPGEFICNLDSSHDAAPDMVLAFRAREPLFEPLVAPTDIPSLAAKLWDHESRRRAAFPTPLHLAADAYIVRRASGRTIVAGYPWFEDWGRDTFIALRGLCLASNRLDEARDMLIEWAGAVSEGMLPNRFVDAGGTPEYNSADASLWYVVAAAEYMHAARARPTPILDAIRAILSGYSRGTRYRIHADEDALLAAGEPGVQLTWMDAKIGEWVVTPRIGKPVELQALWINALHAARDLDPANARLLARARASFADRFWNAEQQCLYDVVDAEHHRGRLDTSIRPNQIFAVGGLPLPLLEGQRARAVVDRVEHDLLTPLGLRSLAPASEGYRPRYEGSPLERDGAYHQGTVWPWLLGPFVEAWVRVRGSTTDAAEHARRRFIAPWRAHLSEGGLGHVSEILDAEPPRLPRGCPFQAWSVAELLRVEALLDTIAPSTNTADGKG